MLTSADKVGERVKKGQNMLFNTWMDEPLLYDLHSAQQKHARQMNLAKSK